MRIFKVSELLSALKPHEKTAFGDFLRSPFHNQNGTLPQLYSLLLEDSSLHLEANRKDIYRRLFPGKKYSDKEVRYIFTEFNRLLEHFFAIREFEKDSREYLLTTQRALLKRKAGKAYAHARLRFNGLEKTENAYYYLDRFRAAELFHSFQSSSLSRLSESDYDEILSSLDKFYFLRKLQLQCELVNLKNILKKEYNNQLIREISILTVAYNYFNSPFLEIYYHILQMLTIDDEETENHFNSVVLLIKRHQSNFPVADVNYIYQYVKNFCIRRINKGEDAYRQKLFEIYKEILSNRRIMNHDYFSPFEYKNIVTLGLRLNEDKWVKQFIPKYINYLPPADRKNALTYNTAMLNFYLKNYRMVIKGLQEVEFTDLYYQMDSRSILLKVYFETDETETMLHHISAFKIFLRRNKLISDFQRSIYQNFIRYTLKIFRAGQSKSKLEKLRSEILSAGNISDRNWLLEKVNEELAD